VDANSETPGTTNTVNNRLNVYKSKYYRYYCSGPPVSGYHESPGYIGHG